MPHSSLRPTKRWVDYLSISLRPGTSSVAKRRFYSAFFANPLLTPYLRVHYGVSPVFNIAYTIVHFQTFSTQDRSTFYLIPSRHLFCCRRRRRRGRGRRITLALCKYGVTTFFCTRDNFVLGVIFDEESMGDWSPISENFTFYEQ